MRLCFYTGNKSGFNVRKTLQNIGEILSDKYSLDIVTTQNHQFGENVTKKFTIFKQESDRRSRIPIELVKYLQKYEPIAVTTLVMPHTYGITASVICKLFGVPHVYRYPSDDFVRYKAHSGIKKIGYFGLNNFLGRISLQMSTKYIVLGENGFNHLTNRGVDPDKVTILPQPISPKRFNSNKFSFDGFLPEDAPLTLFVGRRVWLKGYDILESVLPNILECREDMHIIIIGCGTGMPGVSKKYHDRIHPIGNVDPDIIPEYFRRADVLLVTSRGEGLPRVVLESLLSGTPVVAPPVGEISRVVSNIYTDYSELVDFVINFENLTVDSAERFTINELKDEYIDFFKEFE